MFQENAGYTGSAERPGHTAPSASSILRSWLYFAIRSDRESDPVVCRPARCPGRLPSKFRVPALGARRASSWEHRTAHVCDDLVCDRPATRDGTATPWAWPASSGPSAHFYDTDARGLVPDRGRHRAGVAEAFHLSGHVDVGLTYWYVEAVPELLNLATKRLTIARAPGGDR